MGEEGGGRVNFGRQRALARTHPYWRLTNHDVGRLKVERRKEGRSTSRRTDWRRKIHVRNGTNLDISVHDTLGVAEVESLEMDKGDKMSVLRRAKERGATKDDFACKDRESP
jgi:hypothetical protein